MLNTYKAAGYGDVASVQEFERELEQVAQQYQDDHTKFTL